MLDSANFGQALRVARESAQLSKTELARRSGVTRGTIQNIEKGLTRPCASTERRLREVVRLGGAEDSQPQAVNSSMQWMSPRYDPMQMSVDMVLALNGPGGTLEQTLAYLDSQSAADWFEVSNQPAYQQRVRAEIPVLEFAKSIAKSINDGGLDLIGLGVGDGKSETRLAEALVAQLPRASLHCYLLDISHPLLIVAFKQAIAALPPEVPIFPIHGNFLDLGRILPLQVEAGRNR